MLMLTPEMRVGAGGRRRLLAEGIEARRGGGAGADPRRGGAARLINAIVREELQGELGERISRNLRKLIRQEIAQILDEERRGWAAAPRAARSRRAGAGGAGEGE